jgi:hypothetical protein
MAITPPKAPPIAAAGMDPPTWLPVPLAVLLAGLLVVPLAGLLVVPLAGLLAIVFAIVFAIVLAIALGVVSVRETCDVMPDGVGEGVSVDICVPST